MTNFNIYFSRPSLRIQLFKLFKFIVQKRVSFIIFPTNNKKKIIKIIFHVVVKPFRCRTKSTSNPNPYNIVFSLSSTSLKKKENLNSPQLDIPFYPTFFLDILFCLVVVYDSESEFTIWNFLFKKKEETSTKNFFKLFFHIIYLIRKT